MPTVIDTLIVQLGLDPSQFNKQQRQTLEDFRRGGDQAKKYAGGFEKSGKDLAQTFSSLQNRIVGLLSVFVGGKGAVEFTSFVTRTTAETARMSRVFDTNTETLSAWRGAANVTGGSAEGMTSSIQGLISQFQMFSLTGESSVIPWFRALRVEISDAQGRMRPFGDILLDISDRFSKLRPEKAAAFGKALGFDDGTINLLIKGRVAVAALLEEQKKLGVVTKADAEAGEAALKSWREMEQAATKLGMTLVTALGPSLTGITRQLTEIFSLGGKAGEELDRMEKRRKSRGLKTYEELNKGPEPKGMAATIFGALDFTDTDVWRRLRPSSSITDLRKRHRPTPATSATTNSDIDFLQKLGWSKDDATALAANIQRESAGDHKAVGDGGQAFGLAQWHPDRQENFRKFAGKDIRESTREEQLRFMDHELRTTESRAGDALRRAEGVGYKAAVVSRMYERPKDVEGEAAMRAQIAVSLSKTAQGSVTASGQPAGTSSTKNETNIGTLTVVTQAKDAEAIAKEIPEAIKRQSITAQVNSGPGG